MTPPPPSRTPLLTAVFFAFLSPCLPAYQTALVAANLAVSLAMLAATALSDPGFVPRDPPPPTAWSTPRPPPRIVDVHGVPVATKWCATCAHHRPPRTSHCAVCDNCVRRFDHHCPWVGQCVGERNYRFFLTFVYATAALCVLVQVLCWVRLGRQAHALGNISLAVARDPAALALAFYCLASLAFVGGLAGFHTVLVSRATTTYEHFRGRGGVTAAGGEGGRVQNPYNRGCGKNWASVCCTPVAPILPETRPIADAAVAAGLAPAPAWPPAAGGAFDRGTLRAAAAAPPAPSPPGDIELPPPAVAYGYGPTAAEAALAATQAARAAAADAAAGEEAAGGDVEAPPLPPSPPPPAAGSPVTSSPSFAAHALTAARSLRSALSSAAEEAGGGGGGDDTAAAAAAPPSPAPSTTPTMVTAPGSLATMSMFSADAGEGPPSVARASPPLPAARAGSTSPPRSQSPRRRPPWRPGGGAGPAAHALALSPAHEARLSPPPPRRR